MTSDVKFTLSNPVHFLALGFGSGLLKPAPGTWGTLVAVPLFLAINALQPGLAIWWLIVVLSFLAGIYLCGKTASDVGAHDHGAIVWDEFVGFFVTMVIALHFVTASPINVALAFALFRLFDIAKPWPIRWLDAKVHGGFGIMLDDVIAGIFAAAVLVIVQPLL
ncbi:MAG: phosphatidylglycerophosphatase A [Gammaproteobacteria bacterium]|nr:phosphatidylglycerophosphatase A [Gammaproteobacteria bacterium]